MDYQILLYYLYTDIDDVVSLKAAHTYLCNQLELKGRVLLANEGINGTLSGTKENTDRYMEIMKHDPVFEGIVFKVDEAKEHAFGKLKVKIKPELVNLSLDDDVDPRQLTGDYVSPQEFQAAMHRDDTIVIDARNDYEFDLGHFKGAIRPDIEVFRDLPQWIEENESLLEGKKILTYCTGGVRCEKFSGWLKQKGYTDVGQLHGGIVTYGKDESVRGEDWEGLCYVFDERIAVPVNHVNPSVVGKDYFTGEPCERYINCANPTCHRQMICSEESEAKHLGSCSDQCRLSPYNEYVRKHNIDLHTIEMVNAMLHDNQVFAPKS